MPGGGAGGDLAPRTASTARTEIDGTEIDRTEIDRTEIDRTEIDRTEPRPRAGVPPKDEEGPRMPLQPSTP